MKIAIACKSNTKKKYLKKRAILKNVIKTGKQYSSNA